MMAMIYNRCASYPLEREALQFPVCFSFPNISHQNCGLFHSARFHVSFLYGTKVLMPVGYQEISIVPSFIAH
jgi:hypothetical protein